MSASRLACGGTVLLAMLSAMLVIGCSTSPPAQFFTLTPAAAGGEPVVSTAFAQSIAVGPVSVPEAVNRPQFVVRDGPNRVVVLESHRWAEPLRSGIAEAVAGDLSRALGGARVTPMTQSAAGTAQLDVSLDVQRFDLLVGEAAIIEVVWTIKTRNGSAAAITGRSEARESAQTSGDAYDALAAAQVRALAAVSRDIAERLVQAAPK
jgi:uncharacterized lipoprotein YmbA